MQLRGRVETQVQVPALRREVTYAAPDCTERPDSANASRAPRTLGSDQAGASVRVDQTANLIAVIDCQPAEHGGCLSRNYRFERLAAEIHITALVYAIITGLSALPKTL